MMTVSWLLPLVLFVALWALLAVRLKQGAPLDARSTRWSSVTGRVVLAGATASLVLVILVDDIGVGGIAGIDRVILRLISMVLLVLSSAYNVWRLRSMPDGAPEGVGANERRRLGSTERPDVGVRLDDLRARRGARRR